MPEYSNPQQDPGTEKRLLLVFALTFLIILLFQPLLKKYLPQPATPPAQPQAQAQTAETAAPVPPPASASAATTQAAGESTFVVESDLYRITFSNRGALVRSWVLKKYDDDKGQPLDLVNQQASSKYGYPLALWTYDEALRGKLNSALYVTSGGGTLTAPGELSFDYSDADVSVHKSLRFDRSYLVHVETSVVSKGSHVTALPAWPGGFGDQTTLASYHSEQIEYQDSSDTQRLDIKKVSGGGTLRGPFYWAGVGDSYFGAVFLPDDPATATLITLRNSIDIPKDPQKPAETTPVDVLGAAVGRLSAPTSARLYVGPKSLEVLETVPVPNAPSGNKDLRSLVNLGFFQVIARPLFIWLRWTYGYVHNWGWAIVIQTFIITVALLPLRYTQMKSALKMQRVAPQAKAIQEKYKKYSMRDPRKQDMQKEISELYKKEGVNPIGGCLPLLIQLPFIWAYYKMLGGLIDLRHAHWLWIGDLSSRDPYFILPIAMVLTMILTQRLTPQAGMDPAQQKMMTWTMPLMMGFIFFNLAAGLNLYYMESNLVSIGQQWIMNRTSLGREMREMAEKRARKKDKKDK